MKPLDTAAVAREMLRKRKLMDTVHWYAVRVQYGHELQIRDFLMGIDHSKNVRGKSSEEDLFLATKTQIQPVKMECYVPVEHQRRKYRDRIVWKNVVLTPSLVFVHTALSQRDNLFVSDIKAYIKGFISDRERHEPQPIPDAQMETFRRLADSNYSFSLEVPTFRKGQRVMICAGPMAGQVAEVESSQVTQDPTRYRRDDTGMLMTDNEGNPLHALTIKLWVRLNDLLGAAFEVNADLVKFVDDTETSAPQPLDLVLPRTR